MAVMNISTASKNAAVNAVTALLNVGGAGTINLYTGTQPPGPDTAIGAQVLVGTMTFSATAFGASSGGTAAANAITAGTAVANGTVTWARLQSGAGTPIIDVDVGTSGATMILTSVAFTIGDGLSLSSFTLTHP